MSMKKTNRKRTKRSKGESFQEVHAEARLAAGKKTTAKSKVVKSKPAKNKVSRKKKIVRATAAVPRKSQSVQTVSLEPRVWERAPVWELETFRHFHS